MKAEFKTELNDLINRHSKENESDTPDFLLGQYIEQCLKIYAETVKARDEWYKFDPGA